MEFLKEILGEELFNQFTEKINAFNGDEANKDKQIKIGNLGSGEYVGKLKYDSLQEALTGKDTELKTANKLIAELKKSTKGEEGLQEKIGNYEATVAKLQSELADTKIKSAVKVALLSEKAVDVDYLTFKLNEKLKENDSTLELDENENIKGWDDMLFGLKTQFPNMFDTAQGGGDKKNILENRLPDNDSKNTMTKSELLKKPYAERAKFAEENPEAYAEAMNA